MNRLSISTMFVLFFASSLVHAHTVDLTKGKLTESDGKIEVEIRANLWGVFFEKPVSDLEPDDYKQVLGPAQETTLDDVLKTSLTFYDEDGSRLTPAITIHRDQTDEKTHETPVTFTMESPRLRIQTARNFGTLALVLPDGQVLIPPDSRSETLPPRGSKWQVFANYVVLGFQHIIPEGFDHVLFVLSLFLLAPAIRPLLLQVSAFTIAHTISLALASLKLVSVSPSVVEPLIAISILYTAIENIFVRELKKWRVALVFAFGLLHGLGFAGVLADLGLPREAFVQSLFGFNIGVEFGQLAVLLGASFALGWFRNKPWYRERIRIPGSALIAITALYWTIERLFFA